MATGCANLAADSLVPRAAFIAVVAVFWLTWIGVRWRRDPGLPARHGLRRGGFTGAVRATGVLAAAAIALVIGIGAARGNLSLHWHMLPLLALYPLWGLVQQYLVQALLVGNLARGGWPASVIVPLAAALFGVVHLPNVELAIGTALLGAGATTIYLRHRNLWPLALAHGWLAVPMYFFVLGEDPWLALMQ